MELEPAVSSIQAHFARMRCFVCSPKEENPLGLGLVFEETPDGARVRFRLPEAYLSYPGFLHGGMVSAVLDETMAYASVFKHRLLPFTRNLTIQFRKGVAPAVTHRCESRVIRRMRAGFLAEGAILDTAGAVLVEGQGEFVHPTFAMARRMMPNQDLEPYREFFRSRDDL